MSASNTKPITSKRWIEGAANIREITTRNHTRVCRHETQNYFLVWVDADIELTQADLKDSLVQLRNVINEVNICKTLTACVQVLNEISDGKAFVISSVEMAQHLVPKIHEMSRVNGIFILCGEQVKHEQYFKDWPKIQGVFNSVERIYESLQQIVRQCNHNSIPMNFISQQTMVTAAAHGSNQQNLDQLESSYMYSMIFKYIILEIDDDDAKQMNDFVEYCRKIDVSESQLIDFSHQYHQKSPVWWYTKGCFLYGLLNKALRSLDMECMIKIGFFVRHLHRQLQQLHQEQSGNFIEPFTVYRGQGLDEQDFQKLYETKGGLLSFNNFLSTSQEKEVAMAFVPNATNNDKNIVGVIFIMTIDPDKISTSTTPFALIEDYSAIQEEKEILFSMHTVFRIIDLKRFDDNNRLWEAKLTITGENDEELVVLTNRLNYEIKGSGWYRMGQLMIQAGHSNQAEAIYNELIRSTMNDNDRACVCHKLGWSMVEQAKYKEAAIHMNESLETYRKFVLEDHPALAGLYSDMGLLQIMIGDYPEALKLLQKALCIRNESLPEFDPDVATTYSNIGLVYNNMGNYSKALEFYEKSNQILEKALPLNHPDLARSYDDIGMVCNNINNYSKALECYEKSYKIYEKVLPLNHPDLAKFYNDIGAVHKSMGNYSKALKFHEESLKIKAIILSPNHPDLATSYNNIGLVYKNMANYSKALEFYEKSRNIYEKVLSQNHPLLATSYNNIGQVYSGMGNYSKALEFHEKSLKIKENVLPENHPDLATSYNNIGLIYNSLRDYSKALEFHEKSLKIRKNAEPPNDSNIAISYNNLGLTYSSMGNSSKALQLYEQSYKILEKALHSNHPDLAASYSNIGVLYKRTGNYREALVFLEKALNIYQNCVASTHFMITNLACDIDYLKKKLADED